jgi:hypothetical protein
MPQLMSKDPSIHLVRVAELWSTVVHEQGQQLIANDLNPDLWFYVTVLNPKSKYSGEK